MEFVSKNVAQFGYTVEDFLSGRLPYASIVHPEDMERIAMEVQKHAENGDERFQQEYRILTKNGAVRWIDDRTVIERDRDGRVTHYQGIIIDITERKKVEEAIKKYAQELEESNSIKELFIDIMHHDLINPLTAASGFIELLKEDEIKSRKRVYLETIERNLVKALELMESATRLSKLESSKSIELTDMDLEKVINEVTGNMSPLAADAGMKIENKINMSILVRANKIIEEVFANIMSNAVKYASSGKRIVLDCEKREGCWNIRVMDFGEGIEDRDKKPIFDRFHRLEKKGVKGSGLGLAIASRIMELHNGRIWVEDNPEGGAVFVVEIPKHLY
jgi:PAS domain S-box-containing protein